MNGQMKTVPVRGYALIKCELALLIIVIVVTHSSKLF